MISRMTEPVIVPRAEHPISRRDIDADALKVLYRLHESGYVAYLVGGSVRDLLLSRRPKDFDIGTSAHPYQIKKLFRNCWIIGRRFRLAHVRFGTKTIEVATFRKNVPAGTEAESTFAREDSGEARGDITETAPGRDDGPAESVEPIHRDNTFGTPEEDAFRRDFTINALFYDIGTYSIIDYVGGLQDLKDGLIRSIGDPNDRFQEDPVRMLRSVVMASRLNFRLDPPIVDAIRRHRSRSRSITRSFVPAPRNKRSVRWPSIACSNRSRQRSRKARRIRHCGTAWPPSTPIAAISKRRPHHCVTPSCSAPF
jgi:poly(A) polymerase